MAASFIGSAEAAFIAEIDQRDLNRLVDENVFGDSSLVRRDEGRLFTRIAAALARFHFGASEALSKSARTEVINTVVTRLKSTKDAVTLINLERVTGLDWTWHAGFVTVDLRDAVAATRARAAEVVKANRLIVEDPDIMGGIPTFRGTRVPIDVTVNVPTEGPRFEEFRDSYPDITAEHIKAAATYLRVNPARGRPAAPRVREPISSTRIVIQRRPKTSR